MAGVLLPWLERVRFQKAAEWIYEISDHELMEKRETVHPKYDPSAIDTRLWPLLSAEEEQYDALLQEVIERHAHPLIRKIIGAKLHVYSNVHYSHSEADAAQDLIQEAVAGLIAYLQLSRRNPADYGIKSLDEFVARTALNTYNKYLRGKYPRRHRLKKQLYYLLHKLEELGLWKEGIEWIAGFLRWRQTRAVQRHSKALDRLLENEWEFVSTKLDGKPPSNVPLTSITIGLFEWLDHPLEFDLLVDTVSGLLKIKDHPNQEIAGEWNEESGKESQGADSSELARVDHRKYLKRLWTEIRSLPIKQRWALLGNMRYGDGDGLVNELSPCGIASPKQIADALEIGLEELGGLWGRFPLKDAEIGERLGLSSQQVINLRKSARERLARRMGRRS